MSDIMKTRAKAAFNNTLIAFKGHGAEYIRENGSMFICGYKHGAERFTEDPSAHDKSCGKSVLEIFMDQIKETFTCKKGVCFALFVGAVIGGIDHGADLTIRNANGKLIWFSDYPGQQLLTYIMSTRKDFCPAKLRNMS